MAFNIKDYEMVKDRIPLFYETHKDGRILTEVISESSDRVTIKAYLYKSLEEQVSCAPLSTGIAMEKELKPGVKGIHKYYENCETSAIGRALANLDLYNKNKDRASFEEMKSAELMEEASETKASVYEPSSPPQYQGATTIEHKGVQADIPVQVKQVKEENKGNPASEKTVNYFMSIADHVSENTADYAEIGNCEDILDAKTTIDDKGFISQGEASELIDKYKKVYFSLK